MGTLSPGKKIRIKRLFKDGRALIVALDHGRRHGPIPGIEDMASTLEKVLEGRPDAVMLTPAMIQRYHELLSNVFVVARIDGTGTTRSQDETDDRLISSVVRAVYSGADAVSVMIYPGSRNESMLWEKLARVVEEAEPLGIPVMAEVVPKPPVFTSVDAEVVAYGARIAAELGADIVKTVYASDFSIVTKKTPVPVVVLGASKAPLSEVLSKVEEAVKSGAAGAAIGRNIFQHESPDRVVKALMEIIHGGASHLEVLKKYSLS
ncbi:class I fructose-bisphosphate aldolase [Infirmifilum sp.]|uniref:class I fructose-bisphosphate aldolase n=1 Tax=Infirmifilum sp. TaxID=2856575 RepID=UPI003D13D0E3